ncbi:MetQ/NlpA family ABC transporter substrate-binding protein [Candidatus Berkiella aquae]|uniref:Lipoprotein n=1 Tax=Candidatus Berkiella aquae TaxID=295108 RepID=A0A0Q9YUR1_9GAMM|nr:MetQ/NlpA family ABC transporter substrate-binding protein [Candidatus Berkiella aquae]MCS5711699.1 MetQ/NlpA family ABC transporter substrate-binding protein [Candidatus Berkiella aquae]
MFNVKSLLISLLGFSLIACSPQQRGDDEIIIGTITGPETQLVETAKKVAKDRYGLKLTIVSFEDYVVPNTALAENDIDANMFQHQPYLDVVIDKKKYAITSIGKMFIYPMGVYSKKYKQLSDLHQGAVIGIPNDPSNGARALRLLAKAGIITIPNVNDLELTPKKITSNPKALVIKEIVAAQLPRVLNDLDAAVINTNFAIPAGLSPSKEAIFLEDKNSPYANIVVVRTSEKDKEKYRKLMEALHSPEVELEAKKLFSDQAIPAW